MFKKINLSLPGIEIEKIKGNLFEDHKTFVMFDIKNIDYLQNLLSKKIDFQIKPAKTGYIEISGRGLNPHTDGYVGCSLNYVLEDTESYTIFWQLNEKSARLPNIKKLPDGSYSFTETTGYNYSDLEYLSSFKSTTGDSYLIDVRNIHSVEKYKEIFKRKILSFRWDSKYTLDEIYDSIRII